MNIEQELSNDKISLEDIAEIAKEITEKYERKTIDQLVIKSVEELGEVGEAVLSSSNAPGTSYKGLEKEHVEEEVADTILCLLSIHFRNGGSVESLKKQLRTKMVKWKDKAENG